MKQKLLLLMAFALMGWSNAWATNSEWQFYVYDSGASTVVVNNIYFQTTENENVFKLEGVVISTQSNNGFQFYVHNNWSTSYGWYETVANTGQAYTMGTSGAGWSSLPDGTYDVTFNLNNQTIQFDVHSSAVVTYPKEIRVWAFRNDASVEVGTIPATDQSNGLYAGQLYMTAGEQFWIYEVADDDTWSNALYTNGSNGIVEYASGTTWNMWAGSTTGFQDFTFNLAASSNCWTCTYNAAASTATVTIGATGYATFIADKAYNMPTGLTGYTITGATDGSLIMDQTYSAGDLVPAWTGVLLKGDANDYTINYNADATAANTNRLSGVVEAATVNSWEGSDGNNVLLYKLANDAKKGLGWYFDSANGQSLNCGANKCYLWLTQTEADYVAGSRGFIGFGDGTTAIESVVKKIEINDGVYYNLQGQRVDNPTKGLYIVNGKKVVIK